MNINEAFNAVVQATTDDWTGHLPNCGYTDDEPTCGCAAWGERLHDTLARLLAAARDEARAEAWAGAGDDHGPVNCVPTPEQLLRRMADGTAAERLAWAERAIHNSETAHQCWIRNHRGQIALLERQLRLVSEAAE